VLESVLGPVWVWLAVGERPEAFSLIGGAMILSALVAHTAADLLRPPQPPRCGPLPLRGRGIHSWTLAPGGGEGRV